LGVAALAVSVIALVFAGIAGVAAKRSAETAKRSAQAAEAADRRARTPKLAILLATPMPAPNNLVIYRVRNDGPQDLEGLVIYRPKPTDRIKYPIAVTGLDFAEDEITFGPVPLTQEVRFTLCCGASDDLPEFRI